MSTKVVATCKLDHESRAIVQSGLPRTVEVIYLTDLEAEERAKALKEAEAVLFFVLADETTTEERGLLAGASLLQSLPAGVDILPLAEIPEGPVICANAGAWSAPLAEWVLGMMIALDREFLAYRNELGAGVFNRRWMRWLRGRTFGVVGFGGIGQTCARLVKHLGMNIMAINTTGKTDQEVDFIGSLADLDRVLAESDVVLLSIPLKNSTRGLINKNRLDIMKNDCVLISVGRGAVIDEKDLYQHLKSHPEFKFGADVWWREGENFSLDYPLFSFPNVLGTPHNADLVPNIQNEALTLAVKNIDRHLNNQPLHGTIDRSDYL